VDFELFRSDLEQAVPRKDRPEGGRPFDHVFMSRFCSCRRAIISRTSRPIPHQGPAVVHALSGLKPQLAVPTPTPSGPSRKRLPRP
jgi:hypothetical protein